MLSYLKNLVFNFLNEESKIEDNEYEIDEEKIISQINAEIPSFESPLDLAPKRILLGESEPVEFDVEVFKTVEKIGKVTVINKECGIIDGLYYFEPDQVLGKCNLKVNDEVSYTVYKVKENEAERILKVYPLKDESWCLDHNEIKLEPKTEKLEEITALSRVINGRVIKRNGRKICIEPSNTWCDLDKIEASYVPIEGDWVSLEASVAINEESVDLSGDVLQVTSLIPLVSKSGIGRVTFWSDIKNEGVIENVIYFTKYFCENGYMPNLGDEVVYDAIESDQESYKWRAVKVFPNKEVTQVKLNLCYNNSSFSNKNGIIIKPFSCSIEVELNKTETITLEVVNNNSDSQVLKKIGFNIAKSRSQIILKSPKAYEQSVIQPENRVKYIFECHAKFLGLSREVCIFYFKDFIICRTFEINVVGDKKINNLLNCKADTVFKVSNEKKHFKNNLTADTILYGSKPWKPPKFISGEKRGIYKAPNKLWEVVVNDFDFPSSKSDRIKALEEFAPYFKEKLNFSYYADRFHTLLYLEEIEAKINFRKYDMNGVFLLRQGEFLVLDVPGLVERKPSLIFGDRIIVTQPWSELHNVQQVGYIHEIRQKSIFLKFHESFHQTYDESECNVVFEPNSITLSRCHDAVNRSVKKLGAKWLFPSSVNEKPPQIEFEILEEHQAVSENVANFFAEVSKNNVTEFVSAKKDSKFTKNVEADTPKNIVTAEEVEKNSCLKPRKKLTWFNKNLNKSQKMAVINALKGQGRPLPYIIIGPPGTGKTITMVELIMQIYYLMPESRILVTSPSNSSADLICERLITLGDFKPGQLVRLLAFHRVFEGKVPEKLMPYCALIDMKRDEGENFNPISNQENIQSLTMSQLVGRHRITIGTCVCIGSLHYLGFPPGHFTHILVDEAGQASEPELLIAATFQNIKSGQVVLTGDPLQLGPVCLSKVADNYGLGVSLLQRFVSTFPYVRDINGFPDTSGYDQRFITRLNINYRSVPEILSLPSQMFYNSDLISEVSLIENHKFDLIKKINFEIEDRDETPAIIFHGICGQNYQESDSPSWYNPQEVLQVVLYLRKCYSIGLNCDDVGIITPYAKQVMKLHCLLSALDLSVPKIGTVEDFQGQERNVIIISTVRSSFIYLDTDIHHTLGFVANPRRLNVALTRAKALIIIVGNPILLSTDPFWKIVVEYCIKNNSYLGCNYNLLKNNYNSD